MISLKIWKIQLDARALIALIVAAVVLAGSGYATASQLLSDHQEDVIAACASNNHVRLVGDESDCKRNEEFVEWSVEGPQGEPGKDGEDGKDGDDGDDGIHCWDLNENGVADPDEDTNRDGKIDVYDCRLDGSPLHDAIARQLEGDLYDFQIVTLDPAEIRPLANIEPGGTSKVALPVAGPRLHVVEQRGLAITKILLRPELVLSYLKMASPSDVLASSDLASATTTNGYTAVPVQLPVEQNFLLGGACDPDQDLRLLAPCGALTLLSAEEGLVTGLVLDPELGMSFIEPVDMILGTPGENPGKHIIYNAKDTVNPFTDDEEPPLPGPNLTSLRGAAIGSKIMARPLSLSWESFTTNIVLDGDKEFYAIDPGTVWERMDATFNMVWFIYRIIEPLSEDWGLDMNVKGMEVWVSAGPTTTNKVDLSNEICAPGYFMFNPVDDDELHLFYAGYNVSGVYGRACGIGNSSSSSFGGGTGLNSAYSEALTSQTAKTKWVVAAHEIGHLIGGRHGDGALSECAGGLLTTLCGPSIMPAGSAGAPDTREPYFSNDNDSNIISTLNAVLP